MLKPQNNGAGRARLRAAERWFGRMKDADDPDPILRAAFARVLDEPAPARLLATLDRPAPRAPLLVRTGVAAAASLVAGFGLGWLAAPDGAQHAPPAYASFLEEAGGHAAPVAVAATGPEPAPIIAGAGLTPIAADELTGGAGPVARVIYRDEAGRQFELLSGPLAPAPAEPVRVATRKDGAAAYWTDNGVAYRLSAELSTRDLRVVAERLRARLTVPAPAGPLDAGPEIAAAPEPVIVDPIAEPDAAPIVEN